WICCQMCAAPYRGGGFGHFSACAPARMGSPSNSCGIEAKRQRGVLKRPLAAGELIAGEEDTIADMGIWPWYGALVRENVYKAAEFLEVHTYEHVVRWADQIAERPAVKRGVVVNRSWGDEAQLAERHSASDIDAVLTST